MRLEFDSHAMHVQLVTQYPGVTCWSCFADRLDGLYLRVSGCVLACFTHGCNVQMSECQAMFGQT